MHLGLDMLSAVCNSALVIAALNQKTKGIMKRTIPFVIDNPPSALKVTKEQLLSWGITESEIEQGKSSGKIKSFGMWQIPVSFTALCETSVWDDSRGYTVTKQKTIFGMRTLSSVRQSGYELEGRVSVNGKSVRGFTSSQLFELPDGKLVDVATIFACLSQ